MQGTPPTIIIDPPVFQDPVVFGPFGPQPPWETLPPGVVLLISLALVVGTVAILAPLVRALARRIERGPASVAASDVNDLRARLAALEARLQGSDDAEGSEMQIYQLEERIEFVERLLSRGEGASK